MGILVVGLNVISNAANFTSDGLIEVVGIAGASHLDADAANTLKLDNDILAMRRAIDAMDADETDAENPESAMGNSDLGQDEDDGGRVRRGRRA